MRLPPRPDKRSALVLALCAASILLVLTGLTGLSQVALVAAVLLIVVPQLPAQRAALRGMLGGDREDR